MQCLYCGKVLGVLRELTDGEFCSRQHRQRYRKLTQLALKRLTGDSLPSQAPNAAPAARTVLVPVAGFRPPAGGIYQFCRPAGGEPKPLSHPDAQFSSVAHSQGLAGVSFLDTSVVNSPRLRLTSLSAGACHCLEPARGAHLDLRSVQPVPISAPITFPALSTLSADAGLAAEHPRPGQCFSHRPCWSPKPLSVAAFNPEAPPVLAPENALSRFSMPSVRTPAGPEAVFAARLQAAKLCPLPLPSPVCEAMAHGGSEPVAFNASRPRHPGLLPLAPKMAPNHAKPAGEAVAGRRLPARPISPAAAPAMAASSLLPALASLFRYGRPVEGATPPPQPMQPVQPQDRPALPIAFASTPMSLSRPVLRSARDLSIVETFEYVRPLDEPAFSWLQNLLHLWDRIPAYARFAVTGACLMLFLWAAFPGPALAGLLGLRLGQLESKLRSRAAVELTEDFKSGMRDWKGAGDWSRTWRVEPAGYVRPGKLALFEPSMKMDNYRVEFLAQVERQAVSWAYRAQDEHNYYAAKIRLTRPGPLPLFTLIRYAVIGGEAGPYVEIPIRVLLHGGMPYRVQVSVNGNDYSTSIEGQLVDFWHDDLFQSGGFGFFADSGERARIYWMRLNQKEDFVGRVCAYLFDTAMDKRSSTRSQ